MSVEDASSDDSSQSAPRSRQPLSNRADPENRPFAAPTVRLAEREGTKLREEVTYDSLDGVEAHTSAISTERWASWYEDSRQTQVVVENSKGERTGFRQPNRFTPEYREMLYAKAQSLERSLREKWGRLLHTGMVTLTASTTDDDGNLRPPVEHLRDLLESWEAVRRALSRALDGREWERLAIIEPHKKRSAGYAHVHIGVFVKGPVVAEQFQPVLDAHLENCPTAGEEAHQLFDEDGEPDAVSVHRTADRRNNDGIENLGAYLSSYMAGEYGLEATEMPEYVQTFYTTMWATGTQWWRPSNGAQEYMQPEESQDGDDELAEDWRLVGIAPEGDLDDEIIEIDPEAARGSVYRRLRRDTERDLGG